MSILQLPFFTPVFRPNTPLMNFIESYTWLGCDVCQIVLESADTSLGVIKSEEPNLIVTSLKIASILMSLGIFLAIAWIIRLVSRTLCDRIILFPDSLLQPYSSPNLHQPNARIEALRKELSDQEIPLRQAIFLRAQTFGQSATPYAIQPDLIIASRLRIESVKQKITDKERGYLLAYAKEEAIAICNEFPEVEPILDELKVLQGGSLEPSVQPKNRINTLYGSEPFTTPSLTRLRDKPGGNVLGGNKKNK